MTETTDIRRILDETVRQERGWLISSLVRRLGPARVELAEDVAQDAILKALSTWPYKGVPDNPRAWLRRVAGNAAIDRVRRSAKELGIDDSWDLVAPDNDIITPSLSDPELDLMVLCCDPELAPQDQLILALKTISGFTAAETGTLLFLKEDTLSQRLARAKRRLREQASNVANFPTRFALHDRLPALLRIIYLMFSWGYLPRRGKGLVREDLCREAIRLSEGLMAHAPTAATGHHALHALLLFQFARLPARFGADGALVTLQDQDRSRWDQEAIAKAFESLAAAKSSPSLTRYHFEAGIASIHARAETWEKTDWASISHLYALLDQHASSPAIRVNWAISMIIQGDLDEANALLQSLSDQKGVQSYTGWHLARAKLAEARGEIAAAKSALGQARACMNSDRVMDHIDTQWQSFLAAD